MNYIESRARLLDNISHEEEMLKRPGVEAFQSYHRDNLEGFQIGLIYLEYNKEKLETAENIKVGTFTTGRVCPKGDEMFVGLLVGNLSIGKILS